MIQYSFSREFFGSGASADRRVFVSNELYKTLLNSQIEGVDFVPVF